MSLTIFLPSSEMFPEPQMQEAGCLYLEGLDSLQSCHLLLVSNTCSFQLWSPFVVTRSFFDKGVCYTYLTDGSLPMSCFPNWANWPTLSIGSTTWWSGLWSEWKGWGHKALACINSLGALVLTVDVYQPIFSGSIGCDFSITIGRNLEL